MKIDGHVNAALAKAVCEDMAREQWSDPNAVLKEACTAKEDGARLFKTLKCEEACLRWQDAVADIDKIHESSSWADLVLRADKAVTSQLAEVYFLIRLNIAHIQISDMHRPASMYIAGLMAEDALNSAMRSLKNGFWMKDYRYTPSI